MAGTMSVRRQQAAELALTFFEAHGDEVGTAANERMSFFYQPEERPLDFRLGMKVVARALEDRLGRVIAADEGHLDEQANDIRPNLELKEAGEEVNAQLVFTRRMLTGFYGVALADEILATDGPAARPDQPHLLWRQGKQTAERLRTAPFKEPERTNDSFEFHPTALADLLEPAVERLAKARKAVALERTKKNTTVDEKAEAFEEFDRVFRFTVRFGVVVCLIAGRPRLARRLKASFLEPPRHGSGAGEPTPEPEEESLPTPAEPEEAEESDSETGQQEDA